jgi:biotin operon repressor/anti-sigma regulatory factor (Ser/Thr protein kinase)
MARAGSTREAILDLIGTAGGISGPELAAQLGITRQAVNQHLRDMIASGKVIKTGSTRAARYHPPGAVPDMRSMESELPLASLDESRVYEQVALRLNLSTLPDNVEAIVNYAFTEMLNNAIDHSESDHCRIRVEADASAVRFELRDMGIGVFHSIAEKLELENEESALIDLAKGKTTTMPEAHSGEGIFFVSRAADRLHLRSHRLEIEWDNRRNDVFVSDCRFMAGTLVRFECSRHARTRLENVFETFAPADYDYRFEKTRVAVKLLRQDYVSRSEAKRLLHNLDRFSEIELDLRDVRKVGQGFADEVFRVFTTRHPSIRIRASNASRAVLAMIEHVQARPGRA